MNEVETVVVYNFRIADGAEHPGNVANFKAPRHLIGQRYRGEVLEGTGEEIEASALDSQGRYRRIATGWGELAD